MVLFQVCNMLQIKEYSQKLTFSLFYILNLIGNEKMWLTSIFGASNEKKEILWLTK